MEEALARRSPPGRARGARAAGKLPNFLCVGTVKAGTTSLYHYLKQHPEIYLTPVKETRYFSKDIDPGSFRKDVSRRKRLDVEAYVRGAMDAEVHEALVREWDHYLRLFSQVTSEKAIGEICPDYLYSEAAAREIHRVNPAMRILMILRDPMERAFSHYKMDLAAGFVKADFREALRADMARPRKGWGISSLYVEMGMYAAQVERYLKWFPREQVKVCFYEQWSSTPALLQSIFGFLGVDTGFRPDTSLRANAPLRPRSRRLNHFMHQSGLGDLARAHTPHFVRRLGASLMFRESQKSRLSRADRAYLRDLFAPDVRALSDLLDVDLSHWLEIDRESPSPI